MVEIGVIRIDAIMAIEAGRSISILVSQGEARIDTGVTAEAERKVKLHIAIRVAFGTGETRAILVFLMPLERKTQFVVRKIDQAYLGKRGSCSTVIGMAVETAVLQAGFRQHDDMKILRVLFQIDVAVQTAVRHPIPTPGCSVTG